MIAHKLICSTILKKKSKVFTSQNHWWKIAQICIYHLQELPASLQQTVSRYLVENYLRKMGVEKGVLT